MSDEVPIKSTLYFEDLKEGMQFVSDGDLITQEKVEAFAFAGGDNNPLHLDPSRKVHGKQVVHGELLAAIITALGAKLIGFESILRHVETFTAMRRPVFVGDSVYLEVTVEGLVGSSDRYGEVILRGDLFKGPGKKVASGTRKIIVLRKVSST